jgi:hypothetical protein
MQVSTGTADKHAVPFNRIRIADPGFNVACHQALDPDRISRSPNDSWDFDYDTFCDGTVDLGGILISSIDDTVVDRLTPA